jgi:AraC-like DNA-binding protein
VNRNPLAQALSAAQMEAAPLANYLRAGSLIGYAEMARAVGLSPCQMLETAGLPLTCLDQPDQKIPISAVIRLLEESAVKSGAADFGLRLAEARAYSIAGALGLVTRDQPTVRAALTAISGYMYLASDAMFVRIEECNDLAIVHFGLNLGNPTSARQAFEFGVCNIHRLLRSLSGEMWRPRAVCFSHAAPSDLRPYRRILGSSVEFDHDFNGLVIDRADLDATSRTGNAAFAREVELYVRHLGGRPDTSSLERVRECMIALLPTGDCTADAVASRLGVNRRTVHRRLAAENWTFTALMQRIRSEYAAHYLCSGPRAMSEVAGLLGFSAQSAFTRWFKEHFGCSPSAWRRQQMGRAV